MSLSASEKLAWKIRRDAIEMTHVSNASHIGAAMAIADILAVLYTDVMRYDPSNPDDPNRDRFVLSKGHASAAEYAALAESGFFPVEELTTQYADGSRLSGHVSHAVPGIEFSTGSLGHGAPVACGMALAAKHDGKGHRVFAVVGDGECEEGSIWEMALFARKHELDNFTVIVDRNGLQGLGYTKDVSSLDDLGEKWKAFGWDTVDVDGHDHDALRAALMAPSKGQPRCVVAHTVKGKGVSYMENQLAWHYRSPQGEFYDIAVQELEKARDGQ